MSHALASSDATAGRASWRLTPRTGLAMIRAELAKGLRSQMAHPAGHVVGLVLVATMYLGLQFVLGQGTFQRDLLPRTLVAISAFFMLTYASLIMIADLIEEKLGGTFAQAHLTPAPPWLVMTGRLVTASVLGLVGAVSGTAIPMLVLRLGIPVTWSALVPYSLVLVNVLGFTFMMGAFALNSRAIAALHQMATAMVIMLNGSMLPLSLYPHWLAILARFLPTTLGIEATNRVLFDGASLAGIWSDGLLPLLIGYTVTFAAAGIAIFTRNHRVALRNGTLGQY